MSPYVRFGEMTILASSSADRIDEASVSMVCLSHTPDAPQARLHIPRQVSHRPGVVDRLLRPKLALSGGGCPMVPLMIASAAAAHQPLVLRIGAEPSCRYAIDGMAVPDGQLQAVLRERRRTTSRATIQYDLQTPWRCFGAGMTALARARFGHVRLFPPIPQSASPSPAGAPDDRSGKSGR